MFIDFVAGRAARQGFSQMLLVQTFSATQHQGSGGTSGYVELMPIRDRAFGARVMENLV